MEYNTVAKNSFLRKCLPVSGRHRTAAPVGGDFRCVRVHCVIVRRDRVKDDVNRCLASRETAEHSARVSLGVWDTEKPQVMLLRFC